ncbi:unnamed protein product [Lymnaea stagnalis]|uniref:F-box domain-containing protein n=1 Tax=Lymnaea stagnalis TaxID=6523 RepID=A0AAV2I0C4_LYMST
MEHRRQTTAYDKAGDRFIVHVGLAETSGKTGEGDACLEPPHLLDLPHELLLLIFKHLPASSLLACIRVHTTFRRLIFDAQFLDNLTRQTLGLLNKADDDIRYDTLPWSLSPSMELWFLTHNAVLSTYDDSRSSMTRESFLFPLECFHHSLMTWLAQSMGANISTIDLRPNNVTNKTMRVIRENLFTTVHSLPVYLLQPLTKFALAFPEIISKSIAATHFSLHQGKPSHLRNPWYEGFTHEQRNTFDPQYSMEIMFGQTVDSFSKMSAMAIVFGSKEWLVWTGKVAEFPGCKFEETWTTACLDTHCSIQTVEHMCRGAVDAIAEHTLPHQVINHQWKRQNLFPGLCHRIHQRHREELVSHILEETNSLSHRLQLLLNSERFANNKPNSLTKLLNHLQLPLHQNGHQNAQLFTDKPVAVDSIALTIKTHLHAMFFAEVMEYNTDHDSHQILCPKCSTLWFPSDASIAECVQRISSTNPVPYHLWPYHTLVSIYAMLSESSRVLANS